MFSKQIREMAPIYLIALSGVLLITLSAFRPDLVFGLLSGIGLVLIHLIGSGLDLLGFTVSVGWILIQLNRWNYYFAKPKYVDLSMLSIALIIPIVGLVLLSGFTSGWVAYTVLRLIAVLGAAYMFTR